MCWAVAIPLIGAAVSFGGTMAQASQASAAARAQAQAQTIAARQERDAAMVDEWRARDDAERMLGAQAAGIAASGLRLDSPSGLDLARSSAETAELDARLIRYGGATRASARMYEAQQLRGQAGSSLLMGGLTAGGRLLGQGYDIWRGLK